MPCSAGRELKQMLVNATNEMADASDALANPAVPMEQRERRLKNAKDSHIWTSSTLLEHLRNCSACRERESALRPAYVDPLPPVANRK